MVCPVSTHRPTTNFAQSILDFDMSVAPAAKAFSHFAVAVIALFHQAPGLQPAKLLMGPRNHAVVRSL